jgi:peptidyl-prolyl cis-trans isomerase C
MPWISRLRNEPLVHFTVLGLALFGLYRWVAPRPRERIVLSSAFVAGLREDARARNGRLPTPSEEKQLIDRFVEEEMLYREALSLGLDRGDVIVRRRLVQKMELLSRRTPAEPDEAELARYLQQHRDRYDLPARVTLHHVFYGDAAATVDSAATLGNDWEKQGRAFLAGNRFSRRSQKELAGIFGESAAAQLMSLPVGRWSPLRSRYGAHLVYVDERLPAEAAAVDARVRNDWLEERRAHPDPEALASLRAHYTVERR